jgi:heat shock protein HslJ
MVSLVMQPATKEPQTINYKPQTGLALFFQHSGVAILLYMKTLLLLLLPMVAFACQDQGTQSPSATTDSITAAPDTHSMNAPAPATPVDTSTLTGQWFLQPVLPADTAAGRIPRLIFDLKAGRFTGNTGCNNMSGSFTRTDTSLVIGERIITTKMACTGYNEKAFLESLLRTNRYKFDNGVLVLMFNQTELSRWTRKPDTQPKVNKA